MTILTALLQGTKLLEGEAISAPRLTAEVLLTHALQRERSYLYAHPEEELSEIAWIRRSRLRYRHLHCRTKHRTSQRSAAFGACRIDRVQLGECPARRQH